MKADPSTFVMHFRNGTGVQEGVGKTFIITQPVIAINPMPDVFDGVLLPFQQGDLNRVVQSVVGGDVGVKYNSMAEVKTSISEQLLAVNNIFIGPKSHTSARYEIQDWSQHELQNSCGVIVSTGLGSTG